MSPTQDRSVSYGAKERLAEKLKDVERINKERPCKNCSHYARERQIKCTLPPSRCNFYHSGYDPIQEESEMG